MRWRHGDPAATVIGAGGGAGGSRGSGKGESEAREPDTGAGMGLGVIAWASGASEIREDRVTWRPTLDVARILFAALGVVLALGMGALATHRRSSGDSLTGVTEPRGGGRKPRRNLEPAHSQLVHYGRGWFRTSDLSRVTRRS